MSEDLPAVPDKNVITQTLRKYAIRQNDPVLSDAIECLCQIAFVLDEAECIAYANRTVDQLNSMANELLSGRPCPQTDHDG
jgi:hypothetical protein